MGRKKANDRAVQVRFSASIFESLEDIRREQPKIPTLGATVRRLVDLGLVEMAKKRSAAQERTTTT
jgi:hypothetical protein